MPAEIRRAGGRSLIPAWLLLCAFAGVGRAARAEAVPSVRACARPVTIEVAGESPAGRGDARALALADARRNAVLQACARVEAVRSVAGMRLAGRRIAVRAAGVIEQLRVIEAGAVPGSRPAVYRVRAQAAVRALCDRAACADAPGEGSRAVALELVATNPQQAAEFAGALSRDLQRLGVVVSKDVEGAEAPLAKVRVAGRTGGPWTASWDVSARVAGGTAAAAGYWLLPEDEFPRADLARALAEDLARLTRASCGSPVPEPAECQAAATGPAE